MTVSRVECPDFITARHDFSVELITQLMGLQPDYSWNILHESPGGFGADDFLIVCYPSIKTTDRCGLLSFVRCNKEIYDAAKDKGKWVRKMASAAIAQLP